MALEPGKKAPIVALSDRSGTTRKIPEKGVWQLVYFYPRDNTPGCTTEACAIRDIWKEFKKAKLKVYGVSTDTEKSHGKFIDKYDLPFVLLADPDKKAVKAYGVWMLKKFMGREYMGTMRQSFLIDPTGKIAKVYEKVKPAAHATEVLADLVQLKKGR